MRPRSIDTVAPARDSPAPKPIQVKDVVAEPADPEPPESAQKPVFDVDGRSFRSLSDAVAAAKPGATITLKENAFIRKPVDVRKNLRINLNGFRLTAQNSKAKMEKGPRRGSDFGSKAHAITVRGSHKVIVENGFIDVVSNGGTSGFSGAVEFVPEVEPGIQATATAEPGTKPTAAAEPEPEQVAAAEPEPEQEYPEDAKYDIILRDLEVTSDMMRDGAFRNAKGTMLIDGCTVNSDGGNGSYTVGPDSQTTIRDSQFTTIGEDGQGGWWNNTVSVAFDGHTTIESGTYVTQMAEGVEGTTYGTYVYSSGGTIEITGGEFVADHVAETIKDMNAYGTDYGVSEIEIKDGALSGTMVSRGSGEGAEEMSGVSAYGGVYDKAPTAEQVPEGKMVVDYDDGTFSVENAPGEAEGLPAEGSPTEAPQTETPSAGADGNLL